jgi:predicted nucleotide-binding protein (sugar kinase/HSP70/actin superfamily)
MSREYRRNELGLLRIKPEGWIDDLVFETRGYHTSGQANMSIGIRINDNAGGVLTLDDLSAIMQMIGEHFAKLKKLAEDIDVGTKSGEQATSQEASPEPRESRESK